MQSSNELRTQLRSIDHKSYPAYKSLAGSYQFSNFIFYITDQILQMDQYRPVDITTKVKELCKQHHAPQIQAPGFQIPDFNRTLPLLRKKHNRAGKGRDYLKVKVSGKDSFSLDKETIDLRYVEQLADSEQTCALAYLLRYVLEHPELQNMTIQKIVQALTELIDKKGWAPFCNSYIPCGLARPRIQEIYACINRFRG